MPNIIQLLVVGRVQSISQNDRYTSFGIPFKPYGWGEEDNSIWFNLMVKDDDFFAKVAGDLQKGAVLEVICDQHINNEGFPELVAFASSPTTRINIISWGGEVEGGASSGGGGANRGRGKPTSREDEGGGSRGGDRPKRGSGNRGAPQRGGGQSRGGGRGR